jgi:hypothetical protein
MGTRAFRMNSASRTPWRTVPSKMYTESVANLQPLSDRDGAGISVNYAQL